MRDKPLRTDTNYIKWASLTFENEGSHQWPVEGVHGLSFSERDWKFLLQFTGVKYDTYSYVYDEETASDVGGQLGAMLYRPNPRTDN